MYDKREKKVKMSVNRLLNAFVLTSVDELTYRCTRLHSSVFKVKDEMCHGVSVLSVMVSVQRRTRQQEKVMSGWRWTIGSRKSLHMEGNAWCRRRRQFDRSQRHSVEQKCSCRTLFVCSLFLRWILFKGKQRYPERWLIKSRVQVQGMLNIIEWKESAKA